MTLERIMALTLTDDHARQAEVRAAVRQSCGASPHAIRRPLTERSCSGASKPARFIVIKAYKAAGGTVIEDLFFERDTIHLEDPDLLEHLAQEKLQALAEDTTTTWKWEQTLVRETLAQLRRRLPFDLLGFDVDNDSVFMNETLLAYCEESGIEFTRSRPWHKNDQALVEQKNGSVVRRIVGYRRLEGLAAAAALSRLYGTVRLFVNFFQPSFKLSEKTRDGSWSGNAAIGRQHRAGGGLKMPAHPRPCVTRSPSCRNAWIRFISCSRCDAGSRRLPILRMAFRCRPGRKRPR